MIEKILLEDKEKAPKDFVIIKKKQEKEIQDTDVDKPTIPLYPPEQPDYRYPPEREPEKKKDPNEPERGVDKVDYRV